MLARLHRTWNIEDGRLYLIDIDTDHNGKNVGLEYLFPNQEKVFADWFTGELRVPYGKLVEYIHLGYESRYAKELFLEISKGILVNERKKINNLWYTIFGRFLIDLNSQQPYY